MSNVLNYFEQAGSCNDNIFNLNGTWKINGVEVTANAYSLNKNYRIINDDYTALESDYYIECTEPNKTITLPSAINNNKEYHIDNSSIGNVTMATTGLETIQGESTQILAPDSNLLVVSNGTNWRIK